MTLIEALKTGRRIRRHQDTVWFDPAVGFEFSKEDILNKTDWEIEPERYEFVGEFESCNHIREIHCTSDRTHFDKIPLNKLCKVTVEVLE